MRGRRTFSQHPKPQLLVSEIIVEASIHLYGNEAEDTSRRYLGVEYFPVVRPDGEDGEIWVGIRGRNPIIKLSELAAADFPVGTVGEKYYGSCIDIVESGYRLLERERSTIGPRGRETAAS